MNRAEIREELNKIFIDVFDSDNIALNEDTSFDSIEDWDSLNQVNILVQMEKAFNIKFGLNEVGAVFSSGNVSGLINHIESKLS